MGKIYLHFCFSQILLQVSRDSCRSFSLCYVSHTHTYTHTCIQTPNISCRLINLTDVSWFQTLSGGRSRLLGQWELDVSNISTDAINNASMIFGSYPPQSWFCFFLLQMAEQLFVKGGHIKDAIDMYTAAGSWERAHKVRAPSAF